ncbi:hypothetical protein KKF84_00600, partial [Myxococcota bacterium]|nr:hypothetical protein [Myxococcota bacterium]MBU1533784.1 hypothetical protein [Myxococcota bacterium]
MKCLFSLLLFCVFAVAPVLPSGAMKREVRGGWIYETWEVSDGLPTSSILDIIEGKDGYLWIATFDGLVRFDGQRFFTFDVTNTPGLKSNRILALGFDKSGSLWFRVGLYNAGTIRGGILQTRPGGDDEGNAVLRSIDSRPRHANIPSRLMPAGDLRRSIRDSHGNFWLAMVSGGLVRLSRARVDTVHPEFQVHAVVVDVRGRIWLQSRDRALCVMERIDAPCVELLLPSGKGPALTLGRGEKGEVFAADAASVYRVDGDKPMKMGSVPPGYIPTAVTTLGGELWLGTVKGLFRVTRERTKKVVYHEEMANAIIIELMRDSQGRMWIGTYGKGIFRVTGNRVDRFFDGHGLGGDFIQFVIEDSGGWFWVGTKKGLTVLVNDHPVIIRKNQGLYDNSVFTFLPDGLGNVWISSNKGIFRTPLNELRAFVRGEKLKIVSLHFDESDGMLSRECNGISRLAGARGPAGRLLFACLRGLTAINPAKLSPAGTVPRVALDGVSVDARPLSPTGTISLEPGDRRVTFRFGAIALFGHEKIRYR